MAGATNLYSYRPLGAPEMPHEVIPPPPPEVLTFLLCGEYTAHLFQAGCDQRPLQHHLITHRHRAKPAGRRLGGDIGGAGLVLKLDSPAIDAALPFGGSWIRWSQLLPTPGVMKSGISVTRVRGSFPQKRIVSIELGRKRPAVSPSPKSRKCLRIYRESGRVQKPRPSLTNPFSPCRSTSCGTYPSFVAFAIHRSFSRWQRSFQEPSCGRS